jgi:hypothetical protein
MPGLRDAIVGLTLHAEARAQGTLARRALTGVVKALRGDKDKAASFGNGLFETMAWADALANSWTQAEAIDRGGAFDGCDLRVYLALAERAGVPFVPARTILTLDEDELSVLSGQVPVPGFVASALARGLTRVFGAADADAPAPVALDREALVAKLFDAMDDVPSNWMVRSHIAGPSTLKALAGSGLIDHGDDVVGASQGFAVGPGWVQQGNRRMVDAANARYVELFPQGHGTTIAYLARPWVAAGRRAEGPDPHRHGTPFAGKGSWPCEWRVFVENGRVTGVASYYAWTGAASPLNARKALEAATLAQKMVDAGVALKLSPASMDIELAKRAKEGGATLPAPHQDTLDRFGTGFSCTLDFLEGADGMVFLEGGPAHMPIGGGHPCAFAGVGRSGPGTMCRTEGVALRLMDHVTLADPTTWVDGDHTGCILTWDEARALAAL